MINLNQYILEKLKINKTTEVDYIKDPEKDTIAYDYGGNPWKIIDYIKIENKKEVEIFIDCHDGNGNMKDAYKTDGFNFYKDSYEYLVAAENNEENVVWCWGSDGLCYENEKYKD